MKLFDTIAAWSSYLYIRLHVMRLWSVVHAWLFERNTQAPLKRFASIQELAKFVGTLKWRADTWKDLWDSVSSIEAIMWRALYAPGRAIGDCDEFGRLNACVIRNELRHDSQWKGDGVHDAMLLTVMWRSASGVYEGHNVALLEYGRFTGRRAFAYMDYGLPSDKRSTIEEVVADVRKRYSDGCSPLSFAVSHAETLKPILVCRG